MTPTTLAPESTESKQQQLHIVRLEVCNVMRISGTAEIIPNGDTVILTGHNGAGKSSFLNAIAMLFGGASEIPERPIHDGTSKAHILADLHDLVVTRRFSAAGAPSLVVTAKDGVVLRSPQAVLDALWNKMCDPIKFIRLSDTVDGRRKQAEILRKLVGLDFTELDAKRKAAYDSRTLVNRDLDLAKNKLNSFPIDPTAPTEEVSAAALIEELQESDTQWNTRLAVAQNMNRENAKVKERWKEIATLQSDKKEEIEAIDLKIADLSAQLKVAKSSRATLLEDRDKINTALVEAEEAVAALVYHDEEKFRQQAIEARKPIQQRILAADEINQKVRANKRGIEISKEIEGHERVVREFTLKIQVLDTSRTKLLASAKYPVDGLSFNDDGIFLNGVPFNQGSTAEQCKAAVAIGIALNPPLRVILIRSGNDFDDDSLKQIRELGQASNFQLWIEQVRSDDPGAILIEDGAVVENGK